MSKMAEAVMKRRRRKKRRERRSYEAVIDVISTPQEGESLEGNVSVSTETSNTGKDQLKEGELSDDNAETDLTISNLNILHETEDKTSTIVNTEGNTTTNGDNTGITEDREPTSNDIANTDRKQDENIAILQENSEIGAKSSSGDITGSQGIDEENRDFAREQIGISGDSDACQGSEGMSGTCDDTECEVADNTGSVMNREGLVMDNEGSVVGDEELVVDVAGTSMDNKGSVVDDDGLLRDETGLTVDHVGSLVDNEEPVMDSERTVMDTEGSMMDNSALLRDNDGCVRDNDGCVRDNDGCVRDNDGMTAGTSTIQVPSCANIVPPAGTSQMMHGGVSSQVTSKNVPCSGQRMTYGEIWSSAFTDDDLLSFYYNPQLQHLDGLLEHFIQETLEEDRTNQFYELLNTYKTASKTLRSVEQDIETLRKQCQEQKKNIWTTEVQSKTVQGLCKDSQKVQYTHSYETAKYNKEQATKVARNLDTIKNTLHETFTLAKYSCQLARIHITSFIFELHSQSPVFCGITQQSPVIGIEACYLSDLVITETTHLRQCINCLFLFLRKPTEDNNFCKDISTWLELLVALLLRVASLQDHIYLLHQILRCPPGLTRTLAHYVQPLLWDPSLEEHRSWHHPLLHHFVAMVAHLLLPISLRERYLDRMKPVLAPPSPDADNIKSLAWVVVDEEGEEDDDLSQTWMLIPETDLIAVFVQFPFDELFNKILGNSLCNNDYLTRGYSNGEEVMRVFALSTCLIQILGRAFTLYNTRKYRDFVKRLGRTIRAIVSHVSRYWLQYTRDYVKKFGDNEMTHQYSFGSDYSLKKLQLEYDQLFIKASQQIFTSDRLGTWQFLIDMPFQCLSSQMVHIIYQFLHHGIINNDYSSSLSQYITSSHQHPVEYDSEVLFGCLKSMSESGVVFLLTTFANMAKARSIVEAEFITSVVKEIYEVSFHAECRQEFLLKTGRDLLASISSTHPSMMSYLLEKVKMTLEDVRQDCVLLFQSLPVELWRPMASDVNIIRTWLLGAPVEAGEHQLARYLLTNLNWQYKDSESKALFLPRCLHQTVAIILVETCALRLPNRPGGIPVEIFKQTPSFLEQVAQLATVPYQRIIQHYSDQDLYKWLWEVLRFLRLHQQESGTSPDEGVSCDDEYFPMISKDSVLNLDNDESLVNVSRSANNDGPLACYAALELSNYGHNPSCFVNKGLTYLSVILEEGHIFAVCRIMANIIPMFFDENLPKLHEDTSFIKILNTVVHSEAKWRNNSVLNILSGIIQKHIQTSTKEEIILNAITFWLNALCTLQNWNSDSKVVQLLDCLLLFVFRYNSDAHKNSVIQHFVIKYKETLNSLKEQGFLSSLFSIVMSTPTQGNVVDIKTSYSSSYFCYYTLLSEAYYQEESGLTLALANKLHDKPQMCVETALKKVVNNLNIIPLHVTNLIVYRWANLAASMDQHHSLLPAVWKQFFFHYLRRIPGVKGQPTRGSVGLRFFESDANTTYLKLLKARLMGNVEYHKGLSADTNEQQSDKEEYESPPRLHLIQAKLFQTLVLWLDEARLHDPTLYLQGLPPVYDQQRLQEIITLGKSSWFDSIDIGMMDWQLKKFLEFFEIFDNDRQKKISVIQNRQLLRKTERGVDKLSSMDDCLPPPLFSMYDTPVPDFPIAVLLEKQRIMDILSTFLHKLTEYARKYSMKFSSNSALDYEYLDTLEELYKNVPVKLSVAIPCQRRKVCRGAANIIVQFNEKRRVDMVFQRSHDNRREYETLLHEMLHEMTADICISALCVEKCLTLLLKQRKTCQNPALLDKFEDIGCSIFFMFVDMVSDNVRRFPPTMQFFSTCVELLGKVFIMGSKKETDSLLRTILANPKIVGLLLPIFQPTSGDDVTFIEMYENIIGTPLDVEVKFSLLSKFDFKSWLSGNPSLSHRISMLNVLFLALCDCGFDPPVQTRMLTEMYLRRIRVLLLHQFPDLFGESLRLLIDGSADHALGINCWNEFLLATQILKENTETRELQLNTIPPFLLKQQQIRETMSWLISYFQDQRLSCNQGSTTEGLLTMWKWYVPVLTALYEYVGRATIAEHEQELRRNDAQVKLLLWKQICDFFAPWIFPTETENNVVWPWYESELSQASDFMDVFARILIYFQNFLQGAGLHQLNTLSFVWDLYVTLMSKTKVPNHILEVLHVKLSLLPWHLFYPTVNNLKEMTEVCNGKPACRIFVGLISPRLPWRDVLSELRLNGDMVLLKQFQAVFFHLLVILGNEKPLMKCQDSDLLSLIKFCQSFQWDLLDSSVYLTSCTWFQNNYNFIEILDITSEIWSCVNLLKTAALLTKPSIKQCTYENIHIKRQYYFNFVVQLLCKCSCSHQQTPKRFKPIVEQMMDDIAWVVRNDSSSDVQAITSYFVELLNLLNKVPATSKLLQVIFDTIEEKIRDSEHQNNLLAVIMASCRSLADIASMCRLLEVAIETYFVIGPEYSGGGGNGTLEDLWYQILASVAVPEMSQREFVQECINHNCVLTLFAHVVQTLSECESPSQEMIILKDLIAWATSITPSSQDNEAKIILLWYKIIQVVQRQITYGVNIKELTQQIDFLIPCIVQGGEDRDTSGLLGVIGLGRKSSLSINFRFLCRVFATFLSAQIPSNGLLRIEPNSPGLEKEVKKVLSTKPVLTQRTQTGLNQLENLFENKSYSVSKQYIAYALSAINDSKNTICQSNHVLAKLVSHLFSEKLYLKGIM